MQVITRTTLANILGVKESTVKVWMDGYRFTKYGKCIKKDRRRILVFPFTKEFINTLSEYLEITSHWQELENLQEFLNNGINLT